VADLWRWLRERGARRRPLDERGEIRHLLLGLLIAGFLVVVFHWQGKVTCLYHSVTTAISTPGGGSWPSC
jgi:hypothetical protein